jgi:hypothetical protein
LVPRLAPPESSVLVLHPDQHRVAGRNQTERCNDGLRASKRLPQWNADPIEGREDFARLLDRIEGSTTFVSP